MINAGGALRGQGWKYGSGFVDGIFPVLSPLALEILEFVKEEQQDMDKVYAFLDTIPETHSTWDDFVNVAVQLRLSKQWGPIALVSLFTPFHHMLLLLQVYFISHQCTLINQF